MTTTRFPTVDAVLRAARSQVGTTEHPAGTNETPYGKAFGSDGVYWCGIFVWWCFLRAGIDLRRFGVQHPAFTPSFLVEAAKAGWVRPAEKDIQPGDVVLFDFVPPFTSSGIQHIGIAISRPSRGVVHTIEGNTASGPGGPQDNGGGVFERERSLDVIVAVIRPPYAKPLPKAVIKAKVARAVGAAVASAGAATAVGTAVATGPTHTTVIPAPAASSTARPAVKVTVVPAPRPKPTTVPKPAKRAAPVKATIVGPLRYGMTSPAVKVLQRHLGVTPTGFFGRVTLRKVKAAQQAADIPDDGVVGPVTTRAFGLAYVPAARP